MKPKIIEYNSVSNPHRKNGKKDNVKNRDKVNYINKPFKNMFNNNANNNNNYYDNYNVNNINNQNHNIMMSKVETNLTQEINLDMFEDNIIFLKNEQANYEDYLKIRKEKTPSSQAIELLEEGLINSFVDFFYIYQRKIPDIYNSIRKTYYKDSSPKLSSDQSSNLIPIKAKLILAEYKYMRKKQYNVVISKYIDIRTTIIYSDSPSAVYFNQQAIKLASNMYETDGLIYSLLFMGDCFESQEDADIRVFFKEEEAYLKAYKKYKFTGANFFFSKDNKISNNAESNSNQNSNIDSKATNILESEKHMYDCLTKLFSQIARELIQQSKFNEAIEKLLKQLYYTELLSEALKKESELTKYNNSSIVGFIEESKIDIYLKVSDLYYNLNDYKTSEDYLEKADILINNRQLHSDSNVQYNIYKIKYLLFVYKNLKLICLYQSALTYEAQEEYAKAIDKLNYIGHIPSESIGHGENYYTKSFLMLGRLYYKQNNLEMSDKNLFNFFKESKKNDDKELLELARVNLGMVKGTIGLNNLKNLTKKTDYNDFLKMKLKFFNDA